MAAGVALTMTAGCASATSAPKARTATGSADSTAAPAVEPTGTDLTAVTNATQVTNRPAAGNALKHDQSQYDWYYCSDYNKITTPGGVASAYPYGPNTWAWNNTSDSKWVSATENNAQRTPQGQIQFLYTNWSAESTHTANITFDCSSLYPGYGITGMQVQSIDHITSTTANITWKLGVTVLGESNILSSSSWHLEYGTASGNYTAVSPSQTYEAEGPHGADPRTMTLTGLTPDTTYRFRVVLDVNSYNDFGNRQTSFSDPNNSFTTTA